MKLKNIVLLTAILLPAGSAFAQYSEDALRFSQTEQGASARFRAMGGAQTALGGDNSSLAGNPAGLGFFTKSELSFTPNFTNSKARGEYLGTSATVQKDAGGINQFGLTIYNPTKRYGKSNLEKGWLSFNFGVGYNKTNSFNNNLDYGGSNTNSSFADYLSDYGTQFDYDEGDVVDNAYNAFLIEYDSSIGYYPLTRRNVVQQNSLFQSGSQSEVNLALGANYENKIYIGGAIGLASIRYNVDREFFESGFTFSENQIEDNLALRDEALPYLDAPYRAAYRSSQITTGSGVNAKLGMIYRVDNNVRIGFNFVSPTWYSISDNFAEGLNTRFTTQNGTANFNNPDLDYQADYRLRTPYRLNGGMVYTFKNVGLLTGDVEFVDYASMHYSLPSNPETTRNTNRDIRDKYQGAINVRLGAETKLNPNFSLRAGYVSNGNPYLNEKTSSNIYSGGLGYRSGNFHFDLTYTQVNRKYATSPYVISDEYIFAQDTGSGDITQVSNTFQNVFATIGLRF